MLMSPGRGAELAKRQMDSSFSEEKEAKRLLSVRARELPIASRAGRPDDPFNENSDGPGAGDRPIANQQLSPSRLYERAAPVLLGTFSIAALRTPPL
jgi:hypothetical protein